MICSAIERPRIIMKLSRNFGYAFQTMWTEPCQEYIKKTVTVAHINSQKLKHNFKLITRCLCSP